MAYDGNIPAQQGATKLSEIATDRDQPGIGIVAGDSALVFIEKTRKLVADAARRANYLLTSEGRMKWDGSNVIWNTDFKANNVKFSILQTEPIADEAISVTGDTNNGNPTITNIIGTTNLFVGQLVTGPGIPNGAFVIDVPSSNSVTLNQNATATQTGALLTINISQAARTIALYMVGGVTGHADTTLGSTDLSAIADISAFQVGQYVFGAGIQAGSFVTQILSSTSVRLNKTATATQVQEALDFANAPSFSMTGDQDSTDVISNLAHTAGLKPGMYITGAGIPANTTILQVLSTTSIQISNSATTTVSGNTYTVYAVITSTNYFKSVPLANNEMLYIELDRDYILNNSLPNGAFILENAVNGGSLAPGYTVKKVTVSPTSGMPPLTIPNAGPTNSFFYPFCVRFDSTDGLTTFQDIWWIPHGIRWPQNSSSLLGAIIVSGISAWPDIFVKTQIELQQAILDLSATGGVICITDSFSMDASINVPDNILILGRGHTKTVITMLPGAGFTLNNFSELRGIGFDNTAAWTTGSLVTMASTKTRSIVRDCKFNLLNAGGSVSCVSIGGIQGRVWNSYFTNIVGAGTTRIGLDYLSSQDSSADVDCLFT